MFKYLLKRIVFSIFSLIVVTGIVMLLIFKLLDKNLIFTNDDQYRKLQDNEKISYKYDKWQNYGYLKYMSFSAYVESLDEYKALETAAEKTAVKKLENKIYKYEFPDAEDKDNGNYILDVQRYDSSNQASYYIDKFITQYQKMGWTIVCNEAIRQVRNGIIGSIKSYPILLAYDDINIFVRLWNFFSNMLKFETIYDVSNTNAEAQAYLDENRGIKLVWDELSNMPAIVGCGTTHKYLLYFDDKFPYIHQNFVHINLGRSYSLQIGTSVVDYMNQLTGSKETRLQEFPNYVGTGVLVESSANLHSVTYTNGAIVMPDHLDKFSDNYTTYTYYQTGRSRIGISFFIGIIATLISYILGIPIGVTMARHHGKFRDKLGIFYIVFIMAVPSLAYIFMFRSLGIRIFKLPMTYASSVAPGKEWTVYILPIISLALPSVASLMNWTRRYMIDQLSSDYVKFARAEGLSESTIFFKHISRNAVVPITHGIPGSILGCLTGAIITETVYSVPGVGRILTDSINFNDNGIIVGVTIFYTALSIISLILGDLLMAWVDPRISFADKG